MPKKGENNMIKLLKREILTMFQKFKRMEYVIVSQQE